MRKISYALAPVKPAVLVIMLIVLAGCQSRPADSAKQGATPQNLPAGDITYFGPTAPAGHEGQWIKTNTGKGWFTYFRIYGPGTSAFDGNWKPEDFAEVK